MNKKSQKKKDRQKEVQKKMLLRRHQQTQEAKERRQLDKEDRATRSKGVPILNSEFKKEKALHNMEIMMQIEKNLEILKQYEEEMAKNKADSCELGYEKTL